MLLPLTIDMNIETNQGMQLTKNEAPTRECQGLKVYGNCYLP
jgi:hypothetical protein